MGQKVKSNIAIICAGCLLYGLLCGFSVPQEVVEAREEPANEYESIDVYVDGILTTTGYIVDSTVVYMPVEEFCQVLDITCDVCEREGDWDLCASIDGLELCVSNNEEYMVANDRYLYLPIGTCIIAGEQSLPVAELSKLIGAQVQWDMATGSIDIDTTQMAFIESGESYYDTEDLKWLSQIINAESGNQTIEGMMAVGNVVLNRVTDVSCPDNVYDVIFDTRYGVQFSPVETGGIYCEPNDLSVIAAKLCLEGYNVAGSSLYFVNPETGSTLWFRETRTFVAKIGDHDFYA